MPDTREKLIEVYNKLEEEGSAVIAGKAYMADLMIANGVTVQELDGCDYCKEDAEGYRQMIGAFAITNPFHGSKWQIETAHCKPRQIYFCPMCGRKLAEPPKGD